MPLPCMSLLLIYVRLKYHSPEAKLSNSADFIIHKVYGSHVTQFQFVNLLEQI